MTRLIALVFLLSGSAVFAEDDIGTLTKPDFEDYEAMEEYRGKLYAAYSTCTFAAERRMLSLSEVDICMLTFLKLKLSFLNGVTADRYVNMTPTTRAVANRKGYDAYRAWRHRQIAGLSVD